MTGLKQRLFGFSCGCGEATVVCRHCGWTTRGSTRGQPAQVVFDRSNTHECPGVESHAAMLARDDN